MIFPFPSGAYRYRPLKDGDRGNDVIALQYALGTIPDGLFGPRTLRAVRDFQIGRGLQPVDGIAGVATQQALCLAALWPNQRALRLPPGLGRGMIQGESGFLVGNKSVSYERADGIRADLGPVQFSTPLADEAAVRRALDVPSAIARLCSHLRARHDRYYGQPGAPSHELAWRLACGSWNAPAWTDRIAAGLSVTAAQREWVENYVASKVQYVTRWPA